jgi:LysR family hydrogen peroxide-inducible transcriptional activator
MLSIHNIGYNYAMELHQLRYFLAICQTGSFTAAAQASHVSQPSLSAQVAKLEAELGGALFERGRKGARLTDRGERFKPRASEALRQLEQGRQDLEDLSGLKGGKVSLGCLPTTGAFVLPPLLGAFRKAYPKIQVSLREDSSPGLRKALLDGEVDLAILDEAGLGQGLDSARLMQEPLLLALPPRHPRAKAKHLTLSQLKEESWVLMKSGHGFRAIVDAIFAKAGVAPNVVFESDEIATVQALVASGLGLSLVPRMVRREGVAYVRVEGSEPTRSLALAWRSAAVLSAAAEAMRKTCLKNVPS